MASRSIAAQRARRAAERGWAAGYDRLTYDTAVEVCSATTPAALLAELGSEGDGAEDAARLYAEGTLPRFRREAYDGALEGFRRSGR